VSLDAKPRRWEDGHRSLVTWWEDRALSEFNEDLIFFYLNIYF